VVCLPLRQCSVWLAPLPPPHATAFPQTFAFRHHFGKPSPQSFVTDSPFCRPTAKRNPSGALNGSSFIPVNSTLSFPSCSHSVFPYHLVDFLHLSRNSFRIPFEFPNRPWPSSATCPSLVIYSFFKNSEVAKRPQLFCHRHPCPFF